MPLPASRILSHVEQTEYLKEVARREVDRLLRGADVADLVDDPDAFVEQLLAAILAALGGRAAAMTQESRDYAVALGLKRLSDEAIDKLATESDDEFLVVALPSLLAAAVPARAQVERMLAGASPSTVATALESEATREALMASFRSVLRSAAATYIQGVDRLAISMAFGATDEDRFEWITVQDDDVCDDEFENSCAPRHGIIMDRDGWEDAGNPGAPQLICSIYAKGAGSNCRCQLVPASSAPGILDPVKVTAAIREGKERAALEYTIEEGVPGPGRTTITRTR